MEIELHCILQVKMEGLLRSSSKCEEEKLREFQPQGASKSSQQLDERRVRVMASTPLQFRQPRKEKKEGNWRDSIEFSAKLNSSFSFFTSPRRRSSFVQSTLKYQINVHVQYSTLFKVKLSQRNRKFKRLFHRKIVRKSLKIVLICTKRHLVIFLEKLENL